MIKRVVNLLEMRRNARRYDVAFVRRKTFEMPESICGGRQLVYFNEEGTRLDFTGIFIEDTYRILRIKSPVKHVLDIGANYGFFSVAAKVVFPDAVVHAYEPFAGLSEYLDSNAKEFGFEVFYEAVGGREAVVSLKHDGDANQTQVVETEGEGVKQISIDTAIERIGGSVDLAKIDCEGSEWEMFLEGKLWDRVNRIAMEYHNFSGQPHNHVASELERIGFRVIAQEFDPAVSFGMAYAINESKVTRWE